MARWIVSAILLFIVTSALGFGVFGAVVALGLVIYGSLTRLTQQGDNHLDHLGNGANTGYPRSSPRDGQLRSDSESTGRNEIQRQPVKFRHDTEQNDHGRTEEFVESISVYIYELLKKDREELYQQMEQWSPSRPRELKKELLAFVYFSWDYCLTLAQSKAGQSNKKANDLIDQVRDRLSQLFVSNESFWVDMDEVLESVNSYFAALMKGASNESVEPLALEFSRRAGDGDIANIAIGFPAATHFSSLCKQMPERILDETDSYLRG